MLKKTNIFLYIVFIFVFLASHLFPKVTTAQGLSGLPNVLGQLGGSLNLQGVGAVALSCAKEMGIPDKLPFGKDPEKPDDEGIDKSDTGSNPGNVPSGQAVPITNGVIEEAVKIVKDNTTTIKKEEEKSTKKERCEDKIARYMVLQVMDKITFSTLEWINSGFEGKPFFVENPEQFFGDIVNKEILGFSAEFSGDANLFPFGETIVKSILVSFSRTAQQNMINSLNNVLAHGTRAEWEYDFSVGGWAGYTAFVEPNNNIFGAYIESSRNLGDRLYGTKTSTAINFQRELEQGLGFLSKRTCDQTENGGSYIPENSIQHTVVGFPEITQLDQIPTNVYMYIDSCGDGFDDDGDGQADDDGLCEHDEEAQISIAEDFRGRSICTNWQTSTPGHQIAQQTTKALGMSQDQLMVADEINENLGLIFDALINQFISQGLSSFYDSNGNYTPDNNVAWAQINGFNPGEQQNSLPFVNVIGGGVPIGGATDTEGGNFPGFITLQEDYITKATTLIGLYQQKIQKTRELDYCVPGPNPGWQVIAAQQASVYLENNIPMVENIPPQQLATLLPTLPIPIIGDLFSNLGEEMDTQQHNDTINALYINFIEQLTGVSINEQNLDPQILNRNQFLPIMYQAFAEYAEFINTRFIEADDFHDNLRSKASDFFFEIDDVEYNIGQYEDVVETVTQTLEDLIELREEYAVVEHAYIMQYLQSAVDQGLNLNSYLQTFTVFGNNPSQITYIGPNGQNSAYQDAVEALTTELGEPVVPPVSDPEYSEILEDFLSILQNAVTEENIDAIDQEIEQVIEDIGNQQEEDSLIGLIYSCIYQVNNPGPDSFNGFSGRKAYPFPISNDIPGLLSLQSTLTFLPGVKASANANDVTVNLTPASAVGTASDLQVLETMFMNIGQSLY